MRAAWWKRTAELFRDAGVAWREDNVPRLGASLAYYTLFALAPMLVVAIGVAGLVFGGDAVRQHVVDEIARLVGRTGANAVEALLQGARQAGAGILATIIGTLTLILAATGAFLELETALNAIWRVKPDPHANLTAFVFDRLRAFGMVLAIGFLLLVSLVVSAGLAALSGWLGGGAGNAAAIWTLLNVLVSLAIITGLFALIFRFLPQVEQQWRHIWRGALLTALLFTLGKEIIGLYLGRTRVASSYGAAGSVMVLLLWVYYASQILLFGAEFVRADTRRALGHLPPARLARKRKARPT